MHRDTPIFCSFAVVVTRIFGIINAGNGLLNAAKIFAFMHSRSFEFDPPHRRTRGFWTPVKYSVAH